MLKTTIIYLKYKILTVKKRYKIVFLDISYICRINVCEKIWKGCCKTF